MDSIKKFLASIHSKLYAIMGERGGESVRFRVSLRGRGTNFEEKGLSLPNSRSCYCWRLQVRWIGGKDPMGDAQSYWSLDRPAETYITGHHVHHGQCLS